MNIRERIRRRAGGFYILPGARISVVLLAALDAGLLSKRACARLPTAIRPSRSRRVDAADYGWGCFEVALLLARKSRRVAKRIMSRAANILRKRHRRYRDNSTLNGMAPLGAVEAAFTRF